MFVYEFSFQNLSLVQCEWFTQFLKRYLVRVLIELGSEVHQGDLTYKVGMNFNDSVMLRKEGRSNASQLGRLSVCRCYFSVDWVSIWQISQKVYIFNMLFCIFHIFFRLWTASTHLLHTTITFQGPGRFKQNFKHFQGLENESFQIQVLYRFSSTVPTVYSIMTFHLY